MNTSFCTSLILFSILFLPAAVELNQTKREAAKIEWLSLENAQELAEQNGKKVLIYAFAEWCPYCKKMEEKVFPNKKIQKTLAKYYYPVKVDIESEEKLVFNEQELTGRRFAREYRVSATPTVFFIDKEGEIIGTQPGFIPADIFENLLSYVGTEAFTDQKFKEYLNQKKEEN